MLTVTDKAAPVISSHQILIDAPRPLVWDIQTNPPAWPDWIRDIDSATGTTPLKVGSSFEWATQGLNIVSTVTEIVPGERIAWGGPAEGIVAVHVWTLVDTDAGVLVATEESWAGPAIEANVPAMQAALDASLESWLADLKTESERRNWAPSS